MPNQNTASGNTTPQGPLVPDFDFAGARAAGVSDDDIIKELQASGKVPYDFQGALKAGVPPKAIVDHMAGLEQAQPNVANSLQQGAANVVGGIANTIRDYTGGPGPLSDALDSASKAIAPTAYAPAAIVDKAGVHPGNIAPAVAERAPGLATAVAAARLMPGPWWAKLMAGAAAGTLMSAGNEAQTAAENRTGDPSAAPSTSDLVRGAATAAAENAAGSIGVGRFLPAASAVAETGAKGLAKAATYLAKTTAAEGVSGAAQSVAQQVGQTVGTPGGVAVDPTEVADSAAGNAVAGGALGTVPAARAGLHAVKYRGITPEFQEPATQLANRMQTYADGQTIKDGGAEVFTKARNDIKGELGDAVTDLRSRVALSQDANNILNNALDGQRLTKGDFNALQSAMGDDPQANNVMNLLRQNHVADLVARTGNISNGKFTGGVAPYVGHKLSGENLLKTLLIAGGVEGGHLIGFSPEAMGAIGAGYVGLNAIDRFTGANKPGVRFMNKFADGQTPVRLDVPQPAPQAPTGPSVGPTGPKIPLAPSPWGNGATQAPTPATPPVAGGSIITPQVRAQMSALANLQKLKQSQAAPPQPVTPQPAIDPLALPKSVTAPAAAIARGASLVQKLQQRQQAATPAPEPEANPLALPKSITAPAVNIMRGAALAQKLQQQANGAQASQARQASPPPAGPITKANGATTEGDSLPVAPYANLPAPEAAERILQDVRQAGVPVQNATAFKTKTIALLNTVRGKVASVVQDAPSIPPADVARFEGIRTQKAAMAYRERLKSEYPQAAGALDKHFSDAAIQQQWARK
jgi:hypothetical protein